MTRDASLDATLDLEALLDALRACHEPTMADARRVRLALDATLTEPGSIPEGEEASGVHSKPQGEPVLGPAAPERSVACVGSARRSRLLLGAVAVAAVAAVAVATLAHPASLAPAPLAAFGLARNGDGQEGRLTLLNEPPGESGQAVPAVLVRAAPCQNWPCLDAEPAVDLSLGGAKVARSERLARQHAAGAEGAGDHSVSAVFRPAAPERDPGPAISGRRRHSVRVAPVLALDVASGGVSPGAGVRVAVPVNDDRDLTLEATLQRFEAGVARGRSLWVAGAAACWSPVAGRVDVGLCGDVGYERAAALAGDEWRLTAGASAYAAWNLTRSAAAYLAMQAAVPIAGDGLDERGTVMRVVAGPRLSF